MKSANFSFVTFIYWRREARDFDFRLCVTLSKQILWLFIVLWTPGDDGTILNRYSGDLLFKLLYTWQNFQWQHLFWSDSDPISWYNLRQDLRFRSAVSTTDDWIADGLIQIYWKNFSYYLCTQSTIPGWVCCLKTFLALF